jgi:hypothetical protein
MNSSPDEFISPRSTRQASVIGVGRGGLEATAMPWPFDDRAPDRILERASALLSGRAYDIELR